MLSSKAMRLLGAVTVQDATPGTNIASMFMVSTRAWAHQLGIMWRFLDLYLILREEALGVQPYL